MTEAFEKAGAELKAAALEHKEAHGAVKAPNKPDEEETARYQAACKRLDEAKKVRQSFY
jgi:hypothetical protein